MKWKQLVHFYNVLFGLEVVLKSVMHMLYCTHLQMCATLRREAVTGSRRPMMTSTGSDSLAPPSTPTLGQTLTTPPTLPLAITITCLPPLLTALVRQLKCLQHCTLQVRQFPVCPPLLSWYFLLDRQARLNIIMKLYYALKHCIAIHS